MDLLGSLTGQPCAGPAPNPPHPAVAAWGEMLQPLESLLPPIRSAPTAPNQTIIAAVDKAARDIAASMELANRVQLPGLTTPAIWSQAPKRMASACALLLRYPSLHASAYCVMEALEDLLSSMVVDRGWKATNVCSDTVAIATQLATSGLLPQLQAIIHTTAMQLTTEADAWVAAAAAAAAAAEAAAEAAAAAEPSAAPSPPPRVTVTPTASVQKLEHIGALLALVHQLCWVWPNGICSSAAAGPVAVPTAHLSVAAMRWAGQLAGAGQDVHALRALTHRAFQGAWAVCSAVDSHVRVAGASAAAKPYFMALLSSPYFVQALMMVAAVHVHEMSLLERTTAAAAALAASTLALQPAGRAAAAAAALTAGASALAQLPPAEAAPPALPRRRRIGRTSRSTRRASVAPRQARTAPDATQLAAQAQLQAKLLSSVGQTSTALRDADLTTMQLAEQLAAQQLAEQALCWDLLPAGQQQLLDSLGLGRKPLSWASVSVPADWQERPHRCTDGAMLRGMILTLLDLLMTGCTCFGLLVTTLPTKLDQLVLQQLARLPVLLLQFAELPCEGLEFINSTHRAVEASRHAWFLLRTQQIKHAALPPADAAAQEQQQAAADQQQQAAADQQQQAAAAADQQQQAAPGPQQQPGEQQGGSPCGEQQQAGSGAPALEQQPADKQPDKEQVQAQAQSQAPQQAQAQQQVPKAASKQAAGEAGFDPQRLVSASLADEVLQLSVRLFERVMACPLPAAAADADADAAGAQPPAAPGSAAAEAQQRHAQADAAEMVKAAQVLARQSVSHATGFDRARRRAARQGTDALLQVGSIKGGDDLRVLRVAALQQLLELLELVTAVPHGQPAWGGYTLQLAGLLERYTRSEACGSALVRAVALDGCLPALLNADGGGDQPGAAAADVLLAPGPLAQAAAACGPGSEEELALYSLCHSALKLAASLPGADADLARGITGAVVGACTTMLSAALRAAPAAPAVAAAATARWLLLVGRCCLRWAADLPLLAEWTPEAVASASSDRECDAAPAGSDSSGGDATAAAAAPSAAPPAPAAATAAAAEAASTSTAGGKPPAGQAAQAGGAGAAAAGAEAGGATPRETVALHEVRDALSVMCRSQLFSSLEALYILAGVPLAPAAATQLEQLEQDQGAEPPPPPQQQEQQQEQQDQEPSAQAPGQPKAAPPCAAEPNGQQPAEASNLDARAGDQQQRDRDQDEQQQQGQADDGLPPLSDASSLLAQLPDHASLLAAHRVQEQLAALGFDVRPALDLLAEAWASVGPAWALATRALEAAGVAQAPQVEGVLAEWLQFDAPSGACGTPLLPRTIHAPVQDTAATLAALEAAAGRPDAVLAALQASGVLQRLSRCMAACGAALCAAVATSHACNNSGCSNLAGDSERALVAGSSCGGCRVARYCSVAPCQEASWKQHRRTCHMVKAATAAGGSVVLEAAGGRC